MFKNYFEEIDEYYIEGSLFPSEFTLGFELEAWTDDMDLKENFSSWASDYWEHIPNSDNIDNSTIRMGYDPTVDPHNNGSTCPECGGDGRYTCDYCGGDGWLDCYECGGDGIITERCEECHGDGTVEDECPECDGYGTIEVDGIKKECPNCGGDGTVEEECTECNGDGTVEDECPECNGDGRRDCPECYDGSYEGYECAGTVELTDERTYEWSSPVFKVTPLSLQQIISFLFEGIEEGYINTNESCGFHMHLGFPLKKTKNFDMFWVLLCIAFDLTKYEDILNFNNIRLANSVYAKSSFLSGIRQDLTDIIYNAINYETENENFLDNELNTFIKRYYREEKYRILRMHPQGTFEWRGARGFMDDQRVEDIKAFIYKKFYPFVKWITDKLDEDFLIINGVKIERSFIEELASKIKSPSYKKDFKETHGSKFDNRQDMHLLTSIYKKNPWLKKCNFEDAILNINPEGEILYKKGYFKKGYFKGRVDNDNKEGYVTFESGISFEGILSNSIEQFNEGSSIINSKFYYSFKLDFIRNSGSINPVTVLNSEADTVSFKGMDYLIIEGGDYTNCSFKGTILNSGRFINCIWDEDDYNKFKGGEWINGTIVDNITGEKVQTDLNPLEYKKMQTKVKVMPDAGTRDLDKIPDQKEDESWIDYQNRVRELR